MNERSYSWTNGSPLTRYEKDGTYRGRHVETKETPDVGDHVWYWKCGDDNWEGFEVPPIGGTVTILHCSNDDRFGETFSLNGLTFRRKELHRYVAAFAVGDCPDSRMEYERVG